MGGPCAHPTFARFGCNGPLPNRGRSHTEAARHDPWRGSFACASIGWSTLSSMEGWQAPECGVRHVTGPPRVRGRRARGVGPSRAAATARRHRDWSRPSRRRAPGSKWRRADRDRNHHNRIRIRSALLGEGHHVERECSTPHPPKFVPDLDRDVDVYVVSVAVEHQRQGERNGTGPEVNLVGRDPATLDVQPPIPHLCCLAEHRGLNLHDPSCHRTDASLCDPGLNSRG